MHTETFIKIWWLIHYSNPPVVIPQLYCDVHLLRSPCIILSWKTPKRVNCWHPYLRKLFPLIQMVLDIANWLWKSEFDTFLINSYLHKEFFRTCNILPFSCTHLARTCNILPFSCTHLALYKGKVKDTRYMQNKKDSRISLWVGSENGNFWWFTVL